MWTVQQEELPQGRGLKVSLTMNSAPMTFAEALRRWQNDAAFRAYFNQLLADTSFAAFRWETPPITKATADRPFEFVVLDSPGLARRLEPEAFDEHFRRAAANQQVISFTNLGKDATLIVPCPREPLSAYGHLAAFVRQAPDMQQHQFWQLVAKTMQQRLGPKPVWLSTAGAGVSWLHVRLDDRPKYYGYAPYRDGA
jgi:hypothetical protein